MEKIYKYDNDNNIIVVDGKVLKHDPKFTLDEINSFIKQEEELAFGNPDKSIPFVIGCYNNKTPINSYIINCCCLIVSLFRENKKNLESIDINTIIYSIKVIINKIQRHSLQMDVKSSICNDLHVIDPYLENLLKINTLEDLTSHSTYHLLFYVLKGLLDQGFEFNIPEGFDHTFEVFEQFSLKYEPPLTLVVDYRKVDKNILE